MYEKVVCLPDPFPFLFSKKTYKFGGVQSWLYSVVVITFGSDPNNPSSNPGTTSSFLTFS